MTTFGEKAVGAELNIEIERSTQVFVDTVRDAIDERLAPCCRRWRPCWRSRDARWMNWPGPSRQRLRKT